MPDPKGKEAICCIRQHGLKHRLQLPRRPRYDLQHLRRRRLLLQRLGELARALLLCLKQPHVLDSDHRLVGERPEKRDLLIRKRINFGTSKLNCARNVAGDLNVALSLGFFSFGGGSSKALGNALPRITLRLHVGELGARLGDQASAWASCGSPWFPFQR
jgi:hypothetical protein